MMEAVSAFVAVSSSADIADMKALIVIHHREYTDVVRAMRIMIETVRQWRATAHNLHQYAHHPSLCATARICLLRACCTSTSTFSTKLNSLARALSHSRLYSHMLEELPQCKAALIFAREYKTQVSFHFLCGL